MSNTSRTRTKVERSETRADTNGLRSEYSLDYSRSVPNPFAAKRGDKSVMVRLDPDVSGVFKDASSVNAALRAILSAIPAARPVRKRG